MRRYPLPFVMLTVWVLTVSSAAASPAPARVLVLGSYHMSNPGQDYINIEADDVLAPRRQQETEAVVAALAEFAPTKIAVELLPAREAEFNERYARYRSGEESLRRDERDQLGMRLAARLDHPRLYAIDVHRDLDIGAILAAAERFGQTGRAEALQAKLAQIGMLLEAAQQPPRSVADILAFHNGAELDELHGLYLQLAVIGDGADPVGARMAADWYARNLEIFANLARLVEGPGERILVIYGSGHGTLLREFVRQSPDLALEDALPYLQ